MAARKDLAGARFSRLVALRCAERTPYPPHGALWDCQCDCGARKVIAARSLVRGLTRSCGCLKRENAHTTVTNLTGLVVGKLLVVERVKDLAAVAQPRDRLATRSAQWLCKCECGNACVVGSRRLSKGYARSCGCVPPPEKKEKQPAKGAHFKDLTGQTFGRLRVEVRAGSAVEISGTRKSSGAAWRCRCECGEICIVAAQRLTDNRARSCGCAYKGPARTSRFHLVAAYA